MPIGAIPTGNAKHAVITRALAHEIGAGTYPVGSILPSEQDLSNRFEVSRHTVRVALRTLQELGLVASQQGVGSVVRAAQAEQQYTQSFGSVDDLLQYTKTTRFKTLEREEIIADAEFAARVGGKPGERWWHLYLLRYPKGGKSAVTAADIFIPHSIGTAIGDFPDASKPIFEQIQDLGETVVEIKQDISAAMPTEKEAGHLGIGRDKPILAIVRRYFGERGKLLEVTRTIHPADSFNYSMNVRLASGRARQ
jgi:GntR family transcriptional regulator